MGTLERLQQSIFEYLISLSDLRFADINIDKITFEEDYSKAEGLKILVSTPLPKSASKYSAGPTFSEVELTIQVTQDATISKRTPSLLTICEIISRALHNWTPPIQSGYGKLTLSESQPWVVVDKSTTQIVLKSQSVLQ